MEVEKKENSVEFASIQIIMINYNIEKFMLVLSLNNFQNRFGFDKTFFVPYILKCFQPLKQ